MSGAEVLELLDGKSKLIVARGKKVTEFDLKHDRPDDDELITVMTGRTGNLRAPTLMVGKTVIVGFNEEIYESNLL